jgi:hypothetical protein
VPHPHCTAYVLVKNNTASSAYILLVHQYGDGTPIRMEWKDVQPGATTKDPLAVHYILNDNTVDWWYCELIIGGTIIHSKGSSKNPGKKCTLEDEDNGKTLTFGVGLAEFVLDMPSGGCTTAMSNGGIGILP